MFGVWSYLIWLILAIKLLGYAVWLRKEGYKLGFSGVIFLIAGSLAILLFGTFYRAGLK